MESDDAPAFVPAVIEGPKAQPSSVEIRINIKDITIRVPDGVAAPAHHHRARCDPADPESLFARKFDATEDDEALDLLEAHLTGTRIVVPQGGRRREVAGLGDVWKTRCSRRRA
jgi:hypothetical protein